MSRIEQALRRAAVAAGASVTQNEEHVSSADESISRYPGEDRGGPARPAADALRTWNPVVPQTRARGQLVTGGLDERLILQHASATAVEQYRRLAGVLHDIQAAHGTRILMVSSALPREGKTLTVANLALTLSESYDRSVLLIDADLRRPSLHDLFNLPNAGGLSEGLRSGSAELSPFKLLPRLSVLLAGRPGPDPVASLTSERMQVLLEQSAAEFDWVLLDAPPVGMMPDANLLARLVQGVIFVIAAGSTPFTLVERAVNEIGRDSIVGTVLNRMDEADIPAIGSYAQYYCATDNPE